jgi:hypothetical protein
VFFDSREWCFSVDTIAAASGTDPIFHALINVTGQIIALAVLQGESNTLAVEVEAVAVRLGVAEYGAEFFLSSVWAR